MNRFIHQLSLTILVGLLGAGCAASGSEDEDVYGSEESVSAVRDTSGGTSTTSDPNRQALIFANRSGVTGAACTNCGPIPDPWSNGPIPDPWSADGPIPDPWSEGGKSNGSGSGKTSDTSSGGTSDNGKKPQKP